MIKLYGETIQMKAIEQFFSSRVSVYQAVHRGFNLKSLDKTLVCNHVNEDIKAHALSFGNFSLVYRKNLNQTFIISTLLVIGKLT